eukprot:13080366-Alexandrium_andersonii.AAC.1
MDSLCVMSGDFNCVEYDEGRRNFQEQGGTMDTAVERQAFLQLRQAWGIYPLDLALHSFRGPTCTLKLDRAHTNLHVAEQ